MYILSLSIATIQRLSICLFSTSPIMFGDVHTGIYGLSNSPSIEITFSMSLEMMWKICLQVNAPQVHGFHYIDEELVLS